MPLYTAKSYCTQKDLLVNSNRNIESNVLVRQVDSLALDDAIVRILLGVCIWYPPRILHCFFASYKVMPNGAKIEISQHQCHI